MGELIAQIPDENDNDENHKSTVGGVVGISFKPEQIGECGPVNERDSTKYDSHHRRPKQPRTLHHLVHTVD